MAENKLNYDTAQQEIADWLEFKHISPRKREENADMEEILIDNMQMGFLTKNEDYSLTYKLKEPVQTDEGEIRLSELTFKPRIRVSELNKRLKGVKVNDAEKRQLAYIAAVTGESTGILGQMFSEDFECCAAIVNYFL
jgi:hypothetical protein